MIGLRAKASRAIGLVGVVVFAATVEERYAG
jgi:hypothetical protein